jgi:hypothetical protein
MRGDTNRLTAGCGAVPWQNIEITEALKAHAEAKLAGPLDKFASVINDAQDVDLCVAAPRGCRVRVSEQQSLSPGSRASRLAGI